MTITKLMLFGLVAATVALAPEGAVSTAAENIQAIGQLVTALGVVVGLYLTYRVTRLATESKVKIEAVAVAQVTQVAQLGEIKTAVDTNTQSAIQAARDEVGSFRKASLGDLKEELAALRLDLAVRDAKNGHTPKPRRRPKR